MIGNPIARKLSMILPQSDMPVLEASGKMNPVWYNFMSCVCGTVSNNGLAVNSALVNDVANRALAIASAATTAGNAAAAVAQTTANGALTVATNAEQSANQAIALVGTQLVASRNLSDLPSKPLARLNLGVAMQPLYIMIDSLQSPLIRHLPIVSNLTVLQNFARCSLYCGVAATFDATFTINVIRNGAALLIGFMTLIHGGHATSFSTQPVYNLYPGDVLQIVCPTDATLAQVGLTLGLEIT